MFSKELENLIQATLEDGVLEEYEKAALVKRAQIEGVDLTELEIYIQSILQRRKKELAKEEDAKQAEIDKKKQDALGPVCPKCHKQVPPMTLRCDCGYEFTNNKNNSSVQLLFEKISKIQSQPLINTNSVTPEYRGEMKQRTEQILSLIQLCPVPNTKEDIIEFLSLAISNSKLKGGMWGTISGRLKILSMVAAIVFLICFIIGLFLPGKDDLGGMLLVGAMLVFLIAGYGGFACFLSDQDTIRHNQIASAWRDKFEQVVIKGRSLRGDPEFTQQLDYYENLLNKK
jgi:hypothetical protein